LATLIFGQWHGFLLTLFGKFLFCGPKHFLQQEHGKPFLVRATAAPRNSGPENLHALIGPLALLKHFGHASWLSASKQSEGKKNMKNQ